MALCHHQMETFSALLAICAAVLPMCLSNFKAIRQFKVPISWLRYFTRSYEKTSFRILRRGPGYITNESIGRAPLLVDLKGDSITIRYDHFRARNYLWRVHKSHNKGFAGAAQDYTSSPLCSSNGGRQRSKDANPSLVCLNNFLFGQQRRSHETRCSAKMYSNDKCWICLCFRQME